MVMPQLPFVCILVLLLFFLLFFFSVKVAQRKSASTKKQTSSKILVRNVPFEASKKEIKELFGYV